MEIPVSLLQKGNMKRYPNAFVALSDLINNFDEIDDYYSKVNSLRDNLGRPIKPENWNENMENDYVDPFYYSTDQMFPFRNKKFTDKVNEVNGIKESSGGNFIKIKSVDDIPQSYYGRKALFFIEENNEYKFIYSYINVIDGVPQLPIIEKYKKLILIKNHNVIESLIKTFNSI